MRLKLSEQKMKWYKLKTSFWNGSGISNRLNENKISMCAIKLHFSKINEAFKNGKRCVNKEEMPFWEQFSL